MRLLRTTTFSLESFFDQRLPEYAILSHTWGDEEVTLQELQQEGSTMLLNALKTGIAKGQPLQDIQGVKNGFIKIVSCASQAEKDGLEYIWCDTCCIDKTNSAELSEAINSMYHWYKDRLCYAYLADVPHSPHHSLLERDSVFAKSRWFTRGWTLQELIAPSCLVFFDATWQPIGTRSDFRDFISEKTGIDRDVLDGEDPTLSSIAKRMSWASQRETTRVEDIAYCLMGLFGVNMPLLYGERQKAFLRLQEEIMKTSEDHSLFAWKKPVSQPDDMHCGLLASSPAHFSESRNIVPILQDGSHDNETQAPYSMTNRGINISLSMVEVVSSWKRTVLAFLDCKDTTDARGPLGIFLFCNERGYYRRCYAEKLIPAGTNTLGTIGRSLTRNIYVEQHGVAPRAEATALYKFHLPEMPEELLHCGFVLKVFPNQKTASWDAGTSILSCSRGLGAAVYIGRADGCGLIWLIGIDSYLRPRCIFDHTSDTRSKIGLFYNNKLELAPLLVSDRSSPNQKKTPYWDYWLPEWYKRYEKLDHVRTCASVQVPKFYHSKSEKISKKFTLMVGVTIEEEVVEGQKIFSIHFSKRN